MGLGRMSDHMQGKCFTSDPFTQFCAGLLTLLKNTPGGTQGTICGARMKLWLVECKVSSLPTVIYLSSHNA